jgi:hypothetical protein
MRRRISPILLFVWEIGMGIGLQQGTFDQVPKTVVALALTVPPLLFFSTRETVHRYTKRFPRMSLAIFVIVFLLAGYAAWFLSYKIPSAKGGQDSAAQNDKAISDFGTRLDKFTEALTRNPSIDADAKLAILKEEHDRLSTQRDELTSQEKQTLDSQALTLQSLEEGRKKYLESKELEKRQNEIAENQRQIKQQEQIKKAEKEREPEEIAFARQFAPVIDYIITTLYQMLRQISSQSGEPISSDFPNDRPSLDGSNLYKNGKIIGGKQIIRVGTSKDWEFELWVAGPRDPLEPRVPTDRRRFSASIRAGLAYIVIVNPEIEPPTFRVTLRVDRAPGFPSKPWEKPLYEQGCSLSDYKKTIDQALRELIQNRYIAAPITPKH